MADTKEKKYNVWKSASVSFLKIFGAIVCAYFFVITVIFALFPSVMTKFYNTLGFHKAEELCYERQYQKTNDIADLYNLVLFEQDRNNLKQLQFINELRSRKEYSEFCEELNKSALEETTEKALIPYVGDVNAYLVNQKVKCLFGLGLGVETFIYSELKTTEISEQSFACFVELVKSSQSLSENDKKEKFDNLLDTIELDDGRELSVLVNLRIEKLEEELANESLSQSKKIILSYTLTKTYRACYTVYQTLGNEVKTEEFKTKYNSALKNYNSLIK